MFVKALLTSFSSIQFMNKIIENYVISYVIDIELLLRRLDWLDGAHNLLGSGQVRDLVLLV